MKLSFPLGTIRKEYGYSYLQYYILKPIEIFENMENEIEIISKTLLCQASFFPNITKSTANEY